MDLFKNAKIKSKDSDKKECLYCSKEFKPDLRNVKRGWVNVVLNLVPLH